jgi:hypothetical protein
MMSIAAIKQLLVTVYLSSAVSTESSGSGVLESQSDKVVVRRAAQSSNENAAAVQADLIGHGMSRHVMNYQRFNGWTCGASYNAEPHASKASVAECQRRCSANMNCGCIELDRISGACYMKQRGACQIDSTKCKRSVAADVYVQRAVWGRDPLRLQRSQGRDCMQEDSERGANALAPPSTGLTLNNCREHCAADKDCTCFQWDRFHGVCHKMNQCDLLKCAPSRTFDVYVQEAARNGYGEKYSGSHWGL